MQPCSNQYVCVHGPSHYIEHSITYIKGRVPTLILLHYTVLKLTQSLNWHSQCKKHFVTQIEGTVHHWHSQFDQPDTQNYCEYIDTNNTHKPTHWQYVVHCWPDPGTTPPPPRRFVVVCMALSWRLWLVQGIPNINKWEREHLAPRNASRRHFYCTFS